MLEQFENDDGTIWTFYFAVSPYRENYFGTMLGQFWNLSGIIMGSTIWDYLKVTFLLYPGGLKNYIKIAGKLSMVILLRHLLAPCKKEGCS